MRKEEERKSGRKTERLSDGERRRNNSGSGKSKMVLQGGWRAICLLCQAIPTASCGLPSLRFAASSLIIHNTAHANSLLSRWSAAALRSRIVEQLAPFKSSSHWNDSEALSRNREAGGVASENGGSAELSSSTSTRTRYVVASSR